MPTTDVAYPMIFTIRELVSAEPYLAGVTVRGRGLMLQDEDGSWWLSGVEPGGVAVSGGTPQETYLRFIEALKSILSDIAAESASFDEFSSAVGKFVKEADDKENARWWQRVDALRSGDLVPDETFSSLPKQPAESPAFASVERLDNVGSFSFASARHDAATLAVPKAA